MNTENKDDADEGRRSRPRLFIEAELGAGAVVAVTAAQAHYLRNVMRLGLGNGIVLFNGRDGEFSGVIDMLGKHSGEIRVGDRLRAQDTGSGLRLFFAPTKRARLEYTVEKATELGVDVLQPVITRRTIVHRLNRDRLLAIAIEAAEQCERLSIPAVAEPIALSDLAGTAQKGRRLLVCAEAGKATPIMEVIRNDAVNDAFDILIGPEGGFDEAELDALAKLYFAGFVGLGPRILRADTAAIAALAIVQSLSRDARERPPRRQNDRNQ